MLFVERYFVKETILFIKILTLISFVYEYLVMKRDLAYVNILFYNNPSKVVVFFLSSANFTIAE